MIGLALLSLVGIAFSACGTPDSGGQATGTGGSGVAVQCNNIGFGHPDAPCQPCVNQKCCAELAACDLTPNCIRCAEGDEIDACPAVEAPVHALRVCAGTICADECFPAEPCDPVRGVFDGGLGCMDSPVDGGVTTADCTVPHTAILRGTIDGKPYDQTLESSPEGFSQLSLPAVVALGLPNGGQLILEWNQCLSPDTGPVEVTTGTLKLTDFIERPVKQCSLLWVKYDPMTHKLVYGFHLFLMNGDEITGCDWP